MKFVFIFLLLLSTKLFAVEVKIANLNGNVLYYRDRVISILTERTQLKIDDIIMTKDGRVSLVFEDTTLSFSPHSLFRVTNLKNDQRHEFGEFLMGDFYSVTREKLVDKRRLEVLLPKAKVHIVGTRYIVQIAPSVEVLMARQEGKFQELPRLELIPEAVSSNDLITQITCFEGKVSVITDSAQGKDLEINESALYSGAGANLRVNAKDQAELTALFENLGFNSNASSATSTNRAE